MRITWLYLLFYMQEIGIAVVYAPNGTGKTSFANLLSMEVSEENALLMLLTNMEI